MAAKCEVEHNWRKCWRGTCQQLGGCAEKLKSAPFERQVDTALKVEHEADIRSKVNPLYRDQIGTESHERATLLGEIDRLRAEIAKDRKYMDAMAAECQAMIRLNGEQLKTIEALRQALKEIQVTATPLNYAAGYTAMKHIADTALAKDSSHE